MATMKATAMAGLAAALALAGPASASTDRRFSYSAENEAAKHRTQEIHLLVRQGLFGGVRVLHFYRSRGDGFDVRPVYSPWSDQKLKVALDGDPRGVSLYEIDPVKGEGFARGACKGSPRAWLAMVAPQAFQPLVIAVLGDDPANHAPVVCETLEYRWQGEWQLPTKRNISPKLDDGPTKKF
jgi:hypothetical protein